MTKLNIHVVDYLMDEDAELDMAMEEYSRSSVSKKENKIKAIRSSGEVVGNDNGIHHHRKY